VSVCECVYDVFFNCLSYVLVSRFLCHVEKMLGCFLIRCFSSYLFVKATQDDEKSESS